MEIKLNISKKEITTMLVDAFNKHPQALLLSSTIINNLINTPTGIEHLLKALIGLSVTTKYKIGDTVFVNRKFMPTWRWGSKMESLLFQDSIKCVITNINLYKVEAIELEYDLWDDGAEFCKRDEFHALESSIVLYDDDIELI